MIKINQIFVFNLIVALGFLTQLTFGKGLKLQSSYNRCISTAVNVVYYLLIPLAFVKTYAERELTASDLSIAVTPIFNVAVTYFTMRMLIEKRDERYWNSVFVTSAFPNAVFLGFPLSLILFGTIRVASTYSLTMLVLTIALPDLMAVKKIDLRKAVVQPALIGFATGVALRHILGEAVNTVVEAIRWSPTALSYIATFMLGCKIPLTKPNLGETKTYLTTVSTYRFIVAPLTSLVLASALGVRLDEIKQLIVVSSMPPAVLSTLVNSKYSWCPELSAFTTTILTILHLGFYTILLTVV